MKLNYNNMYKITNLFGIFIDDCQDLGESYCYLWLLYIVES